MKTQELLPLNYVDQSGGMMSSVSDDLMPDSACRVQVNLRTRGLTGALRKRKGYCKTLYSAYYSMNPDHEMQPFKCMGLHYHRNWSGTDNLIVGSWDGKQYANFGPVGFSDVVYGTVADKTIPVRFASFVDRIFRVGGGDETESWDGDNATAFAATQCAMAPRAELITRFKSRLILGRLMGRDAAAAVTTALTDPTLSAVLTSPVGAGATVLHLDSMPFPGLAPATTGTVTLGDEDVTYQPTAYTTKVGNGVIYTDVNGGSDHFKISGGTFAGLLAGATIYGANPANPDAVISVTVLSFVSGTEIIVSASKDIVYGITNWEYTNSGNNDGREGFDLMGISGVTHFWPTGTTVKIVDDVLNLDDSSDFADSGSIRIGSEVVTYTYNNRALNQLEGCSGFALQYGIGTAVTQDAVDPSPSSIFRSSVADTDKNISWDPSATDAGEVVVNPDDGDDLRAFAVVGGYLLMLKLNATYRWNGTSTDPEPVIGVGTVSQECVGVVKDQAYWFHPTGFFQGNGLTPVEISQYCNDFADAITPANYSAVRFFTDGECAFWFVGNVTIGGRQYVNACYEYDPDSKAWAIHELFHPISAGTQIRLISSNDVPGGREAVAIMGATGQGYFMFEGYDDDGNDIGFERETRKMWFDGPATTKQVDELAYFIKGCDQAKFTAAGDDGKPVEFAQRKAGDGLSRQATVKGKAISFRIAGSCKTPVEWRGFSVTNAKTLGTT
jgi:hypothetical protein